MAVAALLLGGGCGSEEKGTPSTVGPTSRPVGDAGAALARSPEPASRPAASSQPAARAATSSQPASAPASGPDPNAPPGKTAKALALEARCRTIVDALKAGKPLTADQRTTLAWEAAAGDRRGRTLRPEFVDALTCLAVAGNDERTCAGVVGDQAERCRRTVAYYRWARKPTPDRAWRCDESGLRKASGKGISRAQFEAMCAALRSGDPTKCPAVKGEAADGCRAEVSLDPSLCQGREHCVEEITRTKAILGGGLAARLPAAKDQEKVQIEAALNGAKACARALDALGFSCGVGPKSPAGDKTSGKKPR